MSSITTLSPVQEIQKNIVVLKEKKKQLSKISIPDERTSSQAVGVAAAAILCAVGVFVVLADFMTLARDFQMLKDNLSGICPSENEVDNIDSRKVGERDSENTQMSKEDSVIENKSIFQKLPSIGCFESETNASEQYTNWSVINPCFSSNKEENVSMGKTHCENYITPFRSVSNINGQSGSDRFVRDRTYSSPGRKGSIENIHDSFLFTHPYLSRRTNIGLTTQNDLNQIPRGKHGIYPGLPKTAISTDDLNAVRNYSDENIRKCKSENTSCYAENGKPNTKYKTDEIKNLQMGYLSQL